MAAEIKQRFRLLKVERIKTFSEPAVDRRMQFARLLHLAPVALEACEAHGGAEFLASAVKSTPSSQARSRLQLVE